MLRTAGMLLLSLTMLIVLAACDDEGGDDSTPGATRSVTIAATSPPDVDIREIDVSVVPDVQNLLTDTGGEFAQETVVYADLTADGVDEAIVPIASGGTQGNLGFVVLTPDGDATQTLVVEATDAGGLALAVEDGVLVLTQAVPDPDDPECCPSFLRETRYVWNGAALAVASVETKPNPAVVTPTPAP